MRCNAYLYSIFGLGWRCLLDLHTYERSSHAICKRMLMVLKVADMGSINLV